MGEGVRAAVRANQQRVALGVVARAFGTRADAHQAAVGVVRRAQR